jgi:hypothetical protein
MSFKGGSLNEDEANSIVNGLSKQLNEEKMQIAV